MPRIAGVNIPEKKQIEISLTYIYGIGRSLSKKILKEANIDPSRKASELSPEETNRLRRTLALFIMPPINREKKPFPPKEKYTLKNYCVNQNAMQAKL